MSRFDEENGDRYERMEEDSAIAEVAPQYHGKNGIFASGIKNLYRLARLDLSGKFVEKVVGLGDVTDVPAIILSIAPKGRTTTLPAWFECCIYRGVQATDGPAARATSVWHPLGSVIRSSASCDFTVTGDFSERPCIKGGASTSWTTGYAAGEEVELFIRGTTLPIADENDGFVSKANIVRAKVPSVNNGNIFAGAGDSGALVFVV